MMLLVLLILFVIGEGAAVYMLARDNWFTTMSGTSFLAKSLGMFIIAVHFTFTEWADHGYDGEMVVKVFALLLLIYGAWARAYVHYGILQRRKNRKKENHHGQLD